MSVPTIIWMLAAVAFAGGVGGIANAFMTDNGFPLPRLEQSNGGAVLRPGFLGNIGIGGLAATVSSGLYGPLATYPILGSGASATGQSAWAGIGLSLASFVGAILVGVGGARWLTNEADKKLLRAAASDAAAKPGSPDDAQRIALASPAEALSIVNAM